MKQPYSSFDLHLYENLWSDARREYGEKGERFRDFAITGNNWRCVFSTRGFSCIKDHAHRTCVNNVSSCARPRPMNKRSAPRFSSRCFVPINRNENQPILPANNRTNNPFLPIHSPFIRPMQMYLLRNCENDLSNSLI